MRFEPLAISQYTLTNCLGAGTAATLTALRQRRSGLVPCKFESTRLDTYVGQVAGLDEATVPDALQDYDCRLNRLVQLSLQQDGFGDAVAEARRRYGPERIGVFLGTSTSGILETEAAYRQRDSQGGLSPTYRYRQTQNAFSIADFARRSLGLSGPALVVCCACSSSSKVFGSAARMIAAGLCDAAIVGGADTLCLTTLYGFSSLELTSTLPCRPFDESRDGISIGEGAGFALLERPRSGLHAPLVLGIGESSDAHHMSTPHPEGFGARLAMERALTSAALSADAIDYINLHGTATRSNDAAEDQAVVDVFGRDTPCSSTKGLTGHLLGAAGITGVLTTALAMVADLIPGSANTTKVDPQILSRYFIDNGTAELQCSLANAFGFGGSNCSIVLGR